MFMKLNVLVKVYLAKDKKLNGGYTSEPVNTGLVSEFKIRGHNAIIQWADRGSDVPPASKYDTNIYDLFFYRDETCPTA